MNGKLAKLCGEELPIQVCRSYAGFYIGTLQNGMPFSRESIQYWETSELAKQALDSGIWTQKQTL